MTDLYLDQSWVSDGYGPYGAFRFHLRNLGPKPARIDRLCYASMTRLSDEAKVTGGKLVRKHAGHVEIAPETGFELEPGAAWELLVEGFTHAPSNRAQGALAAWIETPEGGTVEAAIGDLQPPTGTKRAPRKNWPAGELSQPLCVLPWPAEVAVRAFGEAKLLCPARGTDPAPFARVAALHRRLFPADPAPFAIDLAPGARPVRTEEGDLPPGGYRIDFDTTHVLTHADADGLRHGLVALAQMLHAARTDDRFNFPSEGHIADQPRHRWRGCHLDVARNFMAPEGVARLIDILAWHRMTHLHLHLTDDEGWRLPSKAFPDLPKTARGRDAALPPQFADGPRGQAGSYSADEIRTLVDQAEKLGITIVPEIDLPGHATALLEAIPDLRDPKETPDSYRSIQGYSNNALNPGLDRTWEVVGKILDEVVELFPSPIIHLGGDEVDAQAWTASPAARKLAEDEGLDGTAALQSHFMRRAQQMLAERGRRMGGWDECAAGGGVAKDALLFGWQSPEAMASLIADGYEVVATPGQHYYLDMAEAAGWDARGASWAGSNSPEACYGYEATEGLPDGPGSLAGVQACIWTETIDNTAIFNAQTFPRLSAIAEAGWTPAEGKDWKRFAALSRLMPQL